LFSCIYFFYVLSARISCEKLDHKFEKVCDVTTQYMMCLPVDVDVSENQIYLCFKVFIKISMDTYLARIFPGFYHGRVYKPRSQNLKLSHNMNPFYTFTHFWYKTKFNTSIPLRRMGRTCRVTVQHATIWSVFSTHRVC
jgi:hypothetical protein